MIKNKAVAPMKSANLNEKNKWMNYLIIDWTRLVSRILPIII